MQSPLSDWLESDLVARQAELLLGAGRATTALFYTSSTTFPRPSSHCQVF